MRDTAGEFDDLLAALTSPARRRPPCRARGDDLGQLALAGVEQLAEVEQDRGALGQRGVRHAGNAAAAASITARASSTLPSATSPVTAGRRIRHRRGAPPVPG